LLDHRQSCGSVVARPGQNYADDSATGAGGRGSEQHVDRRPVPVLAWSDRQSDACVLDDHMPVWRSYKDVAVLKRIAIPRRMAGEPTRPLQDAGERARAAGRYVKHNADRRLKVWLKSSDEPAQRLDAARGGPNDDEIPSGPAVIGHADHIPRPQRTPPGGFRQNRRGRWSGGARPNRSQLSIGGP
jgi:hypothetical protein